MSEQNKPSRGEQLRIEMVRKRLHKIFLSLGFLVTGLGLAVASLYILTTSFRPWFPTIFAISIILFFIGGFLLITTKIPRDPKLSEYTSEYSRLSLRSKKMPIFGPIITIIAMIRLVHKDKEKCPNEND